MKISYLKPCCCILAMLPESLLVTSDKESDVTLEPFDELPDYNW